MKKPIALLHIPKTGGTTVSYFNRIINLNHSMVIDHPGQINHTYIYHDPGAAKQNVISLEQAQQYYLITIVRNHFSWLVSYADWVCCFDNWNLDHYDAPYGRKGFDYLINHIMNRDDRWPSRKFIFTQMFTPNGQLVVDHIFHNEDLDNELVRFFDKQGLDYKSVPHKQCGRRNIFKEHIKKEIWEYYSDKLAEEIYETWKDEFQLLGYDADPSNLNTQNGLLSDHILDKELVRYVWSTNEMTHDSMNFELSSIRNHHNLYTTNGCKLGKITTTKISED